MLYVSMLILLAMAYFTSLIYIQFTKKNETFNSIGKGLELGAKKLKTLLLPGILIIAVWLIINKIESLLPKSIYLSIIIFVVYMAWARIYFVNRVESK